jgi:hypothetical protein
MITPGDQDYPDTTPVDWSPGGLLTLLLAAVVVGLSGAAWGVQPSGTAIKSAAGSLDERIRAKCPGAVASQMRAQEWEARHRGPPIDQVTRPALRGELLLRGQLDQQVREFATGSSGMPSQSDPRVARMLEVDADNLQRLHHIVRQDGFPTARMVSYDGVAAAWLILQHATTDPAFQASLLPTIEHMVGRGELGAQNYAMLADRVLLAEGKKQRFGTQFTGLGAQMQMQPVQDPERVDQRRAKLGLTPLADYTCILRVVYGDASE